ncbi:sigma-70 family RNA polymerase sigma factor [Fulvivirgaceae bacterium BMA10]|uniref:RNA polymerase sigma factor n=1 Tax=Splendidivirga corallicola TaxID=3051826 RepID=A0ABT8KMX8_9BACT|nr:sigma-70 family RNA polymerase sigma factor [Fulvivirgaceae bacterium BMA10]
MKNDNLHVNRLVDNLFRREAGKLVALLTRIFGADHIQLAEDIVQDTLLSAMHHWSTNDLPDNPAAWLTQVAKRKAINELKRNETIRRHETKLVDLLGSNTGAIDDIALEKEIKDSQLRMIFTCCHPSLSIESQIALTLKTLCGLSVREIASALLSTETTINKRLYRARQNIRAHKIAFDVPSGARLNKRLDAVILALYLLFNEGYNSSHENSLIRKDLCMEAIRLTHILIEGFPEISKIYALLSLMYLHAARFEARLDDHGTIIIFEDQDRALWDRRLIVAGMKFLKKASIGDQLTEYHLEAGIAAEHCLAKNYRETDWISIYRQYELLYQIKCNPIIELNMAIIISQVSGFEKAIERLEEIVKSKTLDQYYLLPATLGTFYLKIKHFEKAIHYLNSAKKMTSSRQEIDFLEKKLKECQ